MHKTVLIGMREVRQRIRTRGFLLATFAVPAISILIWTFTGMFDSRPALPAAALPAFDEQAATGYVDQAGLVRSIPAPVPADRFRAFPNTAAAGAALAAGTIDAYYVIPPEYRQTGQVRRVGRVLTLATADRQWLDWLLVSRIAAEAANEQPAFSGEKLARLRRPFPGQGLLFVDVASTEHASTDRPGGTPRLPFVVTVAIMMPLFTSGGYLLQSLAQERSNRVMELLLLSVRPQQLLTGKLLGLSALTLVQYGAWFAIGLLAVAVSGGEPARLLAGIQLSVEEVVLIVPYALGGYLLYAALMAGIGALAPDRESSRTWVFVVTLPMLIPLYLWMSIANAPNGLLATTLSLIPFSAPVAMLMRMTATVVPAWQIWASLLLLLLTGLGTIRLTARLFRAQTLLSGEALSLRRLWAAVQAE